jgi:hypothetical protein
MAPYAHEIVYGEPCPPQSNCAVCYPDVSRCRHGVAYSEPCDRCELTMLRDAVDARVTAEEYRKKWETP